MKKKVSLMGQYDYPGEITVVPSDLITMKNIPYPMLGISDKGQVVNMQPEEEYYFEGAEYVTEYPKEKLMESLNELKYVDQFKVLQKTGKVKNKSVLDILKKYS